MSPFKGLKWRGAMCFQPPLKQQELTTSELNLRELFRKESANWRRVTELLCMGFHFTFFL